MTGTPRHARRLLQERVIHLDAKEKASVVEALETIAFGREEDRVRLEAFWSIHAVGGLDEKTVSRGLQDENPYVRSWTVQLATEAGRPRGALLDRFAALASSDPSPVVRLYLASAAQRLPVADRWGIVEGLVSHVEDEKDHNLPLMAWYAAEPLAAADSSCALDLALKAKLPNILPFMVRRVSAIGTSESVDLLVEAIGRARNDSVRLTILDGVIEALKGRRQVSRPSAWAKVSEMLSKSDNPRVRSQSSALALSFGDPAAFKALRDVLADQERDARSRQDALNALLKARDPGLPGVLRSLLADSRLRSPALRGLAAYDDPESSHAILRVYPSLTPDERRDALNTLAARVDSSKALLDAVGSEGVASKDVSADLVRQLRNHKNAEIDARLGKVWGTVRETSADRAKVIAAYRKMITATDGRKPDPELGPRRLRKGLSAMSHPLRHGRKDRSRADRLEPGGPRLRPSRTCSIRAP